MNKQLEYIISCPAACHYRRRIRDPVYVCAHPAFDNKYPFVLLCNRKFPDFPEHCPLVTVEEEGE